VLVECGFVRAVTEDGTEYTFRPSFGRIAALGTPQQIVELFADLHGPKAAETAAYVLAGLSDQEDVPALMSLVGWRDEGRPNPESAAGAWRLGPWLPGLMPIAEQIVVARQLMRHGIAGKARPGAGPGKFSDRFDASEYVSAARVYLGLSSADAEALSMTEFQQMLEMKFPDMAKKADLPTRDEYRAARARFMAMRQPKGVRGG